MKYVIEHIIGRPIQKAIKNIGNCAQSEVNSKELLIMKFEV